MAFNHKRTERMQKKGLGELKAIAESGSLSAAAATYEIDRRDRKALGN